MQIYRCNQTVSQLWQLMTARGVYVPNVANLTPTAAVAKLNLYGFTVDVINKAACLDGHTGIIQYPQAGDYAPTNSGVQLQVYNCT
jgi:hypothetical protein